ncbi:unnamed protein product, partial [marine sediment metagenome]
AGGTLRVRAETRLTKHAKEIDSMVEIKNASGLYMTCNNAPSCFHRARRGPALLCETFDDYVPPTVRIGDRVTTPTAEPSMAVSAAEEDASKYAGLCMNCDRRRTCRHPKPAGGVWHCEDYE